MRETCLYSLVYVLLLLGTEKCTSHALSAGPSLDDLTKTKCPGARPVLCLPYGRCCSSSDFCHQGSCEPCLPQSVPEDVLLDGCRNLLENGTNPVFRMRDDQCGVVACLTHFSPCRLCTNGYDCRANKSLECPSNAEKTSNITDLVSTTTGSLRGNTEHARFDASIMYPDNNYYYMLPVILSVVLIILFIVVIICIRPWLRKYWNIIKTKIRQTFGKANNAGGNANGEANHPEEELFIMGDVNHGVPDNEINQDLPNALQTERDGLKREVDDSRQQIINYLQQIDNLQQEKYDSSKRIEDLQHEVENRHQEILTLQLEVRTLNEEKEQLKRELTIYRQENGQLGTQGHRQSWRYEPLAIEPEQPTNHGNRSDHYSEHDSLTTSPEIEKYNGSSTLKQQKTISEPTEENDLGDDTINVVLVQLTRESMDISNLYAGLQSKWGKTADRDLELAMESLQDRIDHWEKKETDFFEKLKQNGSLGKFNSKFANLWNEFNQTVGKFEQLKKEIKETRPALAGLKSSNNSMLKLSLQTCQTTKPDQKTAQDSGTGLLLHELRTDDFAIGETNKQNSSVV